MADNVVTVLDTTVAEAGVTQSARYNFLKKAIPVRFSISIGTGDTVVVEGKAEAADSFETLHSWTGSETPADVYLSKIWRVRRTVDGTAGDSTVKVENSFNQEITAHV